ncbi:MAG: response regulator [Deltaproteobacteria bacterium]|nr:response regulator [Deltaproteobacteria bacterium]
MIEKKILVVDDEESTRALLERTISEFGYKVELACSAEEALDKIKNEEFQLVITDLKMPEIDGAELCRQIRSINLGTVIYALSGYLKEFEPEQLQDIGFDGHLCKPVNGTVLKSAIEGAFAASCQRVK